MKANYDYEKGVWYIETAIALSPIMKARVVNFMRKQYIARLKGEIGDRKRRMQEAISRLSVQTLEERFLQGRGDKLLYTDAQTINDL